MINLVPLHNPNFRLCLDTLKRTEWNGREHSGMEQSGTIILFHYLDILWWNETNYSFHCLESGQNWL